MNFVEAALLLQGTASVYSKKVEFLWQNVLKMLDLLASQKALEGDQGGCQGDKPAKKNRKGPYHDFNDFRAIVIELSRNTIMKGDNNDTHKEHKDRKMALNFISVTPRQLIEKESRDQKGHVRVNIYGTTAGSASASARGIFNVGNNLFLDQPVEKYIGFFQDLIGHKEDFRVNAQFSMTSATIGEDLEADSDELAQHSVSLCEEELLAEAAAETSLLGEDKTNSRARVCTLDNFALQVTNLSFFLLLAATLPTNTKMPENLQVERKYLKMKWTSPVTLIHLSP